MTSEKSRQNGAGRVIELFGGSAALAEILRVDRTTVTCWRTRNGRIPAKYFKKILIAAEKRKLDLCFDDLIADS